MKHVTTTYTCDICGGETGDLISNSAPARIPLSTGKCFAIVDVCASNVTFYSNDDNCWLDSKSIEDICPRCLRSALESGAKWLTGLIGDEKGD